MKLSEERIASICSQIVDRLVTDKVVKLDSRPLKVQTELERVVIADLKVEEEIEKEANDFVRRARNAPPEGSAAFETLVGKQKEVLAKKRNYVL